jgi:hypothetical protein
MLAGSRDREHSEPASSGPFLDDAVGEPVRVASAAQVPRHGEQVEEQQMNGSDGEPADLEEVEVARERINEVLGIRRFTAAPEGFDPLAAGPRELLVHGYPARPDPQQDPDLHERWSRMLARQTKRVDPEFALLTDQSRGSRHVYGLPAGNGWGGSIAFAGKGNSVTFVSGQWTVPHITEPKPGDCICACWLGIDGANDDPSGNDSYDILQTGTTQVILGGSYYSFAWFEWYPGPSMRISNYPVFAGDTVVAVICVYSPSEAGIYLLNLTTGLGTSFTKVAPEKVKLVGNCAEWVIEDPVSSGLNLGRFGDVYFDACLAGTSSGEILMGGQGSLLPMYDTNGKNIAWPTAETDRLVRVQYVDHAP